MSNDPIIRLAGVNKQYKTEFFAGVKNIDVSIQKGHIVAIVGESGSGKSTILKLIFGLLGPDEGQVSFNGEKVLGPDEKLIPGHDKMKMVTQDFNLNTYAKVYENIAGMLSNEDLQGKKQKTLEMMEFLRIDHLANKRVIELSGGEQQRVAIARAIITEPEVLLLDEPFSQVDALLKNQLRADVKRLSKYLGITIIIVSHDPGDGLSLADEMVILRNGEVMEKGTPQDLYNQPQTLYTAQLLANCNVISGNEARHIGLKSKKDTVIIYPEWLKIHKSWSSKSFLVKDTYFKGFYEEILVEYKGVELKALHVGPEQYRKGDTVQIVLEKFIDFD